MFQNVLADPSFETSDGVDPLLWQIIQDLCDVQGASFNTVLSNVRTGLRSLRINARYQAIGPTDTCGGVLQNVSGLTPFVPYLGGVYCRSSGVFPSVIASVQFDLTTLATVTTNSTNWLFRGGVFFPQASSGVFYIVQGAGTQNLAQARYFDDAILVRLEDVGDATLITQSIKAGVFDPASLGLVPSAEERLRSDVESLGISGGVVSLAPFGRASKLP